MSLPRSVLLTATSFAFLALAAAPARSQETPPPAAVQSNARGSVTGVVRAKQGNEPLDAVTVRLVGTSSGTVTREGGRFVIANVTPGLYTVEATRIGYAASRIENVRVHAGSPTTVDILLEANALRLNDVIVAGVSDPTSGVKVPFVVTKLTAEDVPVPTLGSTANLLKGKVAGATVRTSGGPGGGAFVQLRNPVSVRASTSPMYVVDGVIMLDTFSGYTSEIDPADIASIEVIKGAAAAALYGSKAANGVISITTNRGQNIAQNTARYTLKSELGFSSLGHRMPLATHHRWLVDEDGHYIDALGNPVERSQRIQDPNNIVDNTYGYPTYDPIKQFFETGKTYTTQATIGQNTLATNFLGTLGSTSETGVLRDAEGVRRNNIRLNVDHRAGDKFSLSLGAYYNRWRDKGISGSSSQGIFRDFIDIERDVNLLAPNTDGTPYMRNPDPLEDIVNPLYRESIRSSVETRGGIQSNLAANYRATDWLQFSTSIGYQRVDLLWEYFLPAGVITTGTTVTTGQIQRQADFNEAINGDIGASLVGQWRDFNVRSKFSFAGELSEGQDWTTVAESLTVGGLDDMDIGLDISVDHGRFDRRAKSLVGTTALEYKARYILEGVLRRDGNSRYGPANRWQTNGRISSAWRVAEEPWWPMNAFDEFKLRYSVGSAGNNPDLNDQFQLFSYTGGRIIKSAMGNTELTPENVTEQEMGLDMSIKNRFGIELTYARQVSENLLRANEILSFTGFDTQVQNVGTIIGHTYEATMEAHWFNSPKFRWNSTLVADRSRAKITKYNREACPENLTRYCPGMKFGEMWGYSYVGKPNELAEIHKTNDHLNYFDRNDDGLMVAVGENGKWTDGRWGETVVVDGISYRWGMPILETNPDGSRKFSMMAQGLPMFQYGLTNNFTVGPFNAYILLDGQLGGKNINQMKMLYYHEGVHGDVDQTGKPEYRKKPLDYYQAGISGVTTGLGNGYAIYTDYFLESGTYMKLDELMVGYTIPSKVRLLQRLGMERARVSVVGRNLYSFTRYGGYDPEVQASTVRVDDLDYPRYRTVTAQLEFVF